MTNLEQGVIIACAVASTCALGWLAIILTSACLRQINIEHQLRRIAEALENPVVEVNQAVEPWPAWEDIKVGDPVVLRDGKAYRA